MHASSPRPASPHRALALVGRSHEQEILRHVLDDMLAGHGALLLVSGEAGIGKTTLVEWLAHEAEARGCLVLQGHAYDLSVTPPYGPWLELFETYPEDDSLPPLPMFVVSLEATEVIGSQERLFAAVRDFFQALAAQQPLLLILEDLHWADQASLDFLRVLARRVIDHPILIIATYRPDEIHRRHPLYALLPLLVREARVERIAVQPLDSAAQHALISSRMSLDDNSQNRLADYLMERAEGNPLYTGELLRALEAEGVLRWADGTWKLGDLQRVRLPALLMQVIETRLTRLDEGTRSLLQVAAVIGPNIQPDLWQRISGANAAELETVIEHGLAAQLLAEGAHGTFRFRHALFREVLYEDLVSMRRRSLHRRVAEYLEHESVSDFDVIAYHYQQAGDRRAADWLIKAGGRATARYALQAARARYDAAQEILESEAERMELRGWLLHQLARVDRFTEHERALTYLEEAASIATQERNEMLQLAVLAERGFIYSITGQLDRALPCLTEAIERYNNVSRDQWMTETSEFSRIFDPPRVHSQSDIAHELVVIMESRRALIIAVLAEMGRFERALALWKEWNVRWREPWGNGSVLNASLGVRYAEWALGQFDRDDHEIRDRLRFELSSQAYLTVAGNLEQTLFWRHLQYDADNLTGRAHDVREIVEFYQLAHEHGTANLPSASAHQHAIWLVEGDWDAADRGAKELLDHSQAGESWHAWARLTLARIARNRGQRAHAHSEIAALLTDGPRTEPGHAFFLESQILQRLAASMALDVRDLPLARAWLEAHDRWLDWSGAVLGRADGALLWGEFYRLSGNPTLEREFAENALNHASNPRQPLALVAAHRFLGQLETSDHRDAEAEQHLQRSLLLADACAAPFERALTLFAQAELRLQQHAPLEAMTLLDEVQAICEPLGAKPTLEAVDALRKRLMAAPASGPRNPAGLSPREIEVLRLLAEGKTDREIADVLFISHHTVMRHVSHILDKLGVESRTAAATKAVRDHLL